MRAYFGNHVLKGRENIGLSPRIKQGFGKDERYETYKGVCDFYELSRRLKWDMSGLHPGGVEPIREVAPATIDYRHYAIASKMDLVEQEMTANTLLGSKLERLPSVFLSYCVGNYTVELKTVRDLNSVVKFFPSLILTLWRSGLGAN